MMYVFLCLTYNITSVSVAISAHLGVYLGVVPLTLVPFLLDVGARCGYPKASVPMIVMLLIASLAGS